MSPVLINLILFHIVLKFLPRARPKMRSSYLYFPISWDYRCELPHTVVFFKMQGLSVLLRIATNFRAQGAFYLHILCNREKQQVCATGSISPINMFNLWKHVSIQI
jgi:hypothetical protein